MEDPPKRERRPPKRYIGSATKPVRKKSAVDPKPADEADTHIINVEVSKEDEEVVPPKKGQMTIPKSRGKAAKGGSRMKSRKVVESEPEEDNYLEEEVESEDEGDVHISSDEEQSKVVKGKGKSTGRGKKRKAKRDPVPSPQLAPERTLSSEPLPHKKVKPSLKLDESLLMDGDGGVAQDYQEKTSPASLKPDSPRLKKIKLPAIKKNKPQGTTNTGTSTPTSATPTTKQKASLDIMAATKQSEIRKAQLGATDLDLSNKSIYQELFKSSTESGVARTGLNRRAKEEERRKELNKMKDEYLDKRARDEASSFDLQARHERVARFEDKLRVARSAALFPNFLAAKWKEVHERERRKPKGQHEWHETNGIEEGEVK